ncbi:MAG: SAM-dependent methyltransferase [Marmoricola sp.]
MDEADETTAHWNARYDERDRIWSGAPNAALVATVSDLAPGRALDLGCGEGADSAWLAERGWRVTGVDVSTTAAERARALMTERGLADRVDIVVADLSRWLPEDDVDLVTASFLHSTVELPRTEILRRTADVIRPGGHLLVVGHAAPPPWSQHSDHHDHEWLTASAELAELALAPGAWETVVCESREREATGPDGQAATLEDTVVLVRRTDR